MVKAKCICFWVVLVLATVPAISQRPVTSLVPVGDGWAANSVNTVVFRKNSLVSWRQWQFIAYYNAQKQVVLGRRKLGSKKWTLVVTPFSGNAADAHNSISIMVDGDGYLHLAWDHHNNPLNYARSIAPASLQMGAKMPMTGSFEEKLSYPEFYKLPSGDLIFLYRDGGSGKGNLVINFYTTKTKTWKQLHANLIDGEGQRNAYWQACTDANGSFHISWVWRESPDVASNHDMAYARTDDGGKTWVKSTGEKYVLPITAATADYVCRIPQNSELINQTSMYAADSNHVVIASYWRKQNDSIPQYHLVCKTNNNWKTIDLDFRKTPFTLSGGGTKRIPISRPQVLLQKNRNNECVLVFRDAERGEKISMATCNISTGKYEVEDIYNNAVGAWEPTYDSELFARKGQLHLFVQRVVQADGEGITTTPAQPIFVLQWQPKK